MKTWIDIEKAFQDAGIKYQQKDWVFLVEIESRKFYYSPQSGKWRLKGKRAWKPSDSVEDFIAIAKEHLRAEKEAKNSAKSGQKGNQKKKGQKTKASNSQRQQNHRQRQELKDEVRPEFLELFDEKIRVCNERNYKPAWIWKVLLDKYLLTPKEICWLCTVFDYSPGWAYHQAKTEHPLITRQEILASMGENRSDWLNYFNSRWQFSYRDEERQENRRERENNKQEKGDRYNSSSSSSTQNNSPSQRYQRYLDILRVNYPFSRQELKIAYRKKALETHPDTGGDNETFRSVHTAFEVLSELAS